MREAVRRVRPLAGDVSGADHRRRRVPYPLLGTNAAGPFHSLALHQDQVRPAQAGAWTPQAVVDQRPALLWAGVLIALSSLAAFANVPPRVMDLQSVDLRTQDDLF